MGSVIFADGQFVGLDEPEVLERRSTEIKATKEVGILAKVQAWDKVEALAQAFRQIPPPPPPSGEDHIQYTFRQLAASRLLETRKLKGEAAAGQLARAL